MTTQFERLCKPVRCDAQYRGVELPPDWPSDAHPYKVVLRYHGRQLTVPFFTGSGWTREPSASDVLECLVSDASSVDCAQSFEEWASDLGYDTDSRKAEETYKNCVKAAAGVKRLLGNDYQDFLEAER